MKALDEIYKIYILFAPLESDRKTMKSASGKRPPDEAHGPGKEAFALLKSDRKTMKSAFGKRPPDEAHGPGKEVIRPQQRGLGK